MKNSNQALDALSQSVFAGTAWWSACIAGLQFLGAVLESWRNQPVLLWLDILSGAAGAGAAILCLCRLPVPQKRTLVIVLVSLAILFEVETAFHDPDYSYYDSRQYIIVIVSMLFLGIVFPGTPSAFVYSASFYIAYYVLRSFGASSAPPNTHTWVVFVLQLFAALLICAGIQWWIFRLRYTNIIQADELRAAQTGLGRQMMLRDIHDHLGSRLADLSNLVGRIRTDRSEAMLASLEAAAAEAATLLRQGILAARDREMLADDFGNALRVILFGRYEAAGRQILVRFRGQAETALRGISEQLRNEILAMVLEITTNDLKYGLAPSTLEFRTKGDGIQLRFLASTSRTRSFGLGSSSVRDRVNQAGGVLVKKISRNRIMIRIDLPLLEGFE